MPIYAYKCESCGYALDVLQKMSDAALQECPACKQPALKKQVTAAGFQLKGSGWYATDFKGGPSAGTTTAPAPATSESAAPSATEPNAAKTEAPAAASTPVTPSGS